MDDALKLQLNNLQLSKVTSTDKVIGRGAYGRAIEVYVHGTLCAAKEIHPALVENVSAQESEAIRRSFCEECVKASRIHHPNIVQMLGIYYPTPEAKLPWLVMELMQTSLKGFLEKYEQGKVPLHFKLSMLVDVAQGLEFLHGQDIIHRDLSSNNVLLTKNLTAKIADLGVAKVVQENKMKTHTQAPGTIHFMPPETLLNKPRYGKPVDVFSLACVALHVMSHQWPEPKDLFLEGTMTALKEMERRDEYITFCTQPALKELVELCLQNEPEQRPEISTICVKLKEFKVTIEKQVPFATDNNFELFEEVRQLNIQNQQLSAAYRKELTATETQLEATVQALDILYNQLQKKDQEIQERDNQLQAKDQEIRERDDQLQEKGWQIRERDNQLQKKDWQIRERDDQLQENDWQILERDHQLQGKDRQIQERDTQLQEKDRQIQGRDNQLQGKDRQIQERDVQLQEKDRQIRERDNQLQEKDRQIQERDNQLHEKDWQLRERDDQFQEKDQEIRERDDKIKEKDQYIRERNIQLHKKDQQIRQKDNQLREKDQRIRERDKQLREKDWHLRVRDDQFQEKDRQIRERDNELREKNQQIRERDDELREKDQQIRQRITTAKTMELQLVNKRSSTSEYHKEMTTGNYANAEIQYQGVSDNTTKPVVIKTDLTSLKNRLLKTKEVREKAVGASGVSNNSTNYLNLGEISAFVTSENPVTINNPPDKRPMPSPRTVTPANHASNDTHSALSTSLSKKTYRLWQCAHCQTINEADHTACEHCKLPPERMASRSFFCEFCQLMIFIPLKAGDFNYVSCPRCKQVHTSIL